MKLHKKETTEALDPVEITLQIGKTVQEKQFEPFNATVTMKAKVLPTEVSSEFRRVNEILEDELAIIMNARISGTDSPEPKRKGRHLRS